MFFNKLLPNDIFNATSHYLHVFVTSSLVCNLGFVLDVCKICLKDNTNLLKNHEIVVVARVSRFVVNSIIPLNRPHIMVKG
jgi:hypothetical protein